MIADVARDDCKSDPMIRYRLFSAVSWSWFDLALVYMYIRTRRLSSVSGATRSDELRYAKLHGHSPALLRRWYTISWACNARTCLAAARGAQAAVPDTPTGRAIFSGWLPSTKPDCARDACTRRNGQLRWDRPRGLHEDRPPPSRRSVLRMSVKRHRDADGLPRLSCRAGARRPLFIADITVVSGLPLPRCLKRATRQKPALHERSVLPGRFRPSGRPGADKHCYATQ